MANFYDETRIYGFRYYQEKLLEKPFFLGVNGISGEAEEGKPWSLSSNPIFCEVYDNANFEDLVVFLLYICHYNNEKDDIEIAELFEQFQKVFSKILDRFSPELPGVPVEIDDIMATFNLLNIMSDMLFTISKCLSTVKDSEQVNINIKKAQSILKKSNEADNQNYFPTNPLIPNLILAGLSYLVLNLIDICHIIMHNDLKKSNNIILGNRDAIVFGNNSDVIGVEDSFFGCDFLFVDIAEEFIYVTPITHSLSFNSNKMEEVLSEAKWEKKTFQIMDDSPILSKENLDNFELLVELCDNPEQPVANYEWILYGFGQSFWMKKLKNSSENESILLLPEEIQFMFQYMTQILNSLKVIKERVTYRMLVEGAFTEFGKILNHLRFPEIDRAICIETSVILSKSLMDLLSDPTVEAFLPGMSAEMMVVLIKINIFLSRDRNMASVHETEDTQPFTITVRDIKPIMEISNISKLRKSSWSKLLGDQATAKKFLQNHNEGDCPVCYSKMQEHNYNLLLCQHIICDSCLEKLLGQSDTRMRCPACRNPLCEYLPSGQIEKLSSASQQ